MGERRAAAEEKARGGWLFYGLVGLLFAATLAWMIAEYRDARPAYVGLPAPDFELPVLNAATGSSGRLALSALRGQPVLLNFWSVTCGPCLDELPDLAAAYERYRGAGLMLVAVNTDGDPSMLPHVRDFVARGAVGGGAGLTFPVLFDEVGEVSARYKVTRIPHTVLVGRDGVVRKVLARRLFADELTAEVEALLGS
ncbi:MAG TPA: TlpA disulfide reductase family protein [Myxococcota bacterium]|nr:TlpA disulfide reductase family protein [Myxococcota bacterium]